MHTHQTRKLISKSRLPRRIRPINPHSHRIPRRPPKNHPNKLPEQTLLSHCRYRLKAIERRISAPMNTAVDARSIDNPPARTGRSTRRTGLITGSVQA